jgi:trans-aconitate 2-methyltransferase
MSGPVDWDAQTYHQVAAPQEEWGREVLARLELTGDETVLDAGCGSGRVTALICDRLPNGRVIGVDGSPSMIEHARENLAEYGDRVDLIVSDLLELQVDEPVDAIFSNATFHWILNHELLFERLFAALRPGGVVEAQCGGTGNIAEWQRELESLQGDERFADYLSGMPSAWNYASVGDTRDRLQRAGFELEPAAVWLERRTVEPPDPRAFARSVGLSKHLALLPDSLHEEFIDAVLGSMSRPLVLEYVRLNLSARRPG